MELSKRLEMVAGLVTQERIADIGTDHGYVPIYLYKQGRIKKAYACDVRKGPLEKCKKNRQEQNENMKFELAKTP